MRTPQRSTLASFALKTLTGAIASAVFVTSAYAAGLGKLTVHSALGQPLNAEIELTSVSSEEASGLVAKLASPDAFRLANIEFNPALMSLRFNVEQRGSRQFIKITSAQPLNEPFVDMLLELSWSNGRLVREYTFLLDPAEMRTAQAPQVAAAEAPARAAAQTDNQARSAQRPAQRATPARQDSEQPARDAVSEYKVKPGDTLGGIARTVKPVDISLDMMLVALYRANPEAFSGNNMNRLKSGRILAVPDSEAIKGGTNAGEARGVVVAHAADFTAYRNKLAGQVATAAPDRGRSNTQSAAGKITAQVKEQPTAASEAQDKLRLSKAQADSAAAAGAAGAPLSAEEKIAKDRALADATARVKELERNVTDLENLMAVKSKAGSDAAKPAPETAPADAPAAAPATPAAGAPVEVLEAKPAVAPAPSKKVRKPAPSEPTFADTVMDNATSIALGVGAVLLGLLGISALRRRKAAAQQPAAPSEPSVLGAPSEQAHSLFAETGGQSVDTNNSVFNSSFAPSASQLDTNEVDPVAEADVYIAYGRDAQAEEILKEALRTHPERMPVRLKLLEIYAARKDLRAFETQASEVYGITRGHGDDWAQAAMLGLALDPNNPLYASAAHATPMAHSPTAEELAQQVMLSNQLDDPLTATPAPADDEIEHIDLTDAKARDQAMDLDLDLAADAAAVPRTPSAPAADQDQSLDFDLGGLSFEPQPAAAPAAADDDHVLDFSLPDTVTPVPVVPPVAAPIAEPEPALAAGADDERFDMAFDMGFDEPAQEGAAPEVTHARALDDISLDLPRDDTPGVATPGLAAPGAVGSVDLSKDFGLPPLPETPAPATADHVAHPLSDLDAMDFDLPDDQVAQAPADQNNDDDLYTLDLPGATPATPPADATPPQFDMASIDLDLPPTDNEPLSPLDDSPTALPDLDGLDGLDELEQQAAGAEAEALSAVHMEMETKLDLAVAYQEIGDKEGARELLDEVIKGGSPEQVGRANEMRAKLA